MAAKKTIKDDLQEIKHRLSRIEDHLKADERERRTVIEDEEAQLAEMEKLEELEEEIKRDVGPKPLTRITYRDVTKGIIGSFFGIVGHFAFFYGGKIAHEISALRASALIITSLVILILFLYFSGFRAVKRDVKHHYLAWRALVIFATAHIVVAFVLFLFGRITLDLSLVEIYKNIGAVSILAVMGAATADLIGGE